MLCVPGQRFPCSTREERPWWGNLSPAACWRITVGRISTLQAVEDFTLEQVDVPWRELQPVESPFWTRLVAGTAAQRSPQGSKFSGRKMGYLDWSSLFLKNWTLWKESVLEQGKTEQVAETVLTDSNSHSTSAVWLRGGGRVISAWRRAGWRISVSHYQVKLIFPKLILFGPWW